MNLHSMARILTSILVFFLATHAQRGIAQETDNAVELRWGRAVKLETGDQFRLEDSSTIEFQFKLIGQNATPGEPVVDPKFAGKTWDQEREEFNFGTKLVPYQPMVISGSGNDLGFAIVLLEIDGQSCLSVVSDFSEVGTANSYVPLIKRDSFGDLSPHNLQPSTYYHIAVVKHDDNNIDVYLDGLRLGSMKCSFNETSSKPLTLGWAGGLNTRDSSIDETVTQAFPIHATVGGFRIWNRALGEFSVNALQQYGRSCEPHTLTMILEYGSLLAYGDFRDPNKKNVQLVFPNSVLGGVWSAENKKVIPNYQGSGSYLDYPVYTFIPITSNVFNVFEDTNAIGRMRQVAEKPGHWTFQHFDSGWPTIQFEMKTGHKKNRPYEYLICSDLPNTPRPFAGLKNGKLKLERGTLDDGAGFSNKKFFDFLESKDSAAETDMTKVFLMNNELRYKNMLYLGYNVTKMDGINLTKNGIETEKDNFIFALPREDQHKIDSDKIRIIPNDLKFDILNFGEASSSTTYYSNSKDYSSAITGRLGMGTNTSVAVQAGFETPLASVSVTSTSSWHIVGQGETLQESLGMDATNQEKVVSKDTFHHYRLHHKKDVARLSSEFQKEIRDLYHRCSGSSKNVRNAKIAQLFDEWGTHYVFGGTYGAMKWSETTLDEQTTNKAAKSIYSFFLSVTVVILERNMTVLLLSPTPCALLVP